MLAEDTKQSELDHVDHATAMHELQVPGDRVLGQPVLVGWQRVAEVLLGNSIEWSCDVIHGT